MNEPRHDHGDPPGEVRRADLAVGRAGAADDMAGNVAEAAMAFEARLHAWVDRARVQSSRAHAVYSGFPVGAVVVSGDGHGYDGVNVENAAYGSTMCAERVAIGSMVAAGDRSGIAVVAIAGRGPDPLTPCGACRQVIAEFATPDTEIVSRSADGRLSRWHIDELLPESFGPLRLAMGTAAPEDTAPDDADDVDVPDVGGAAEFGATIADEPRS